MRKKSSKSDGNFLTCIIVCQKFSPNNFSEIDFDIFFNRLNISVKFAFYDTHIEFLKYKIFSSNQHFWHTLKRNGSKKRLQKTENYFINVYSNLILQPFPGLGCFILTKKAKIVVPIDTVTRLLRTYTSMCSIDTAWYVHVAGPEHGTHQEDCLDPRENSWTGAWWLKLTLCGISVQKSTTRWLSICTVS